MTGLIIAIDGTAASGKGTLAKALAEKLGFAHMDTGALYRLVALSMLENNQNSDDIEAASAAASALKNNFKPDDTNNPELRTDRVSQMTSKISAIPEVRAEILDLQREFSINPPALPDGTPAQGAILDGRDIGTVVCPEAPVKFFVTADTEIRAQRRYKELQSKGFSVKYEPVLADMRERDARDAGRKTAPMKPADDAVTLDTSHMTIDQVIETALSHIRD